MSNHLTTDARHYIHSGCPIEVDVLVADERVEIVIGAQRATGEVVRLVVSDPNVCYLLANRFILARSLLSQVIEDNKKHDPALSQMDSADAFPLFGSAMSDALGGCP